jgi:hypothetical protein
MSRRDYPPIRGGRHSLAEQVRREYVVLPLHHAAKFEASWYGVKKLCEVTTHLEVNTGDA